VYTLPSVPSASLLPLSLFQLPTLLAQTRFPAVSSRETKASVKPALARFNVPAPGSKSAVPLKLPVTITESSPPSATSLARSLDAPPQATAQTKSPAPSSLQTNASLAPALVKLNAPPPGSKSAVSEKWPAAYTLPSAATASAVPASVLVPPRLLAHTKSPAASNFHTNASEPPAPVSGELPAPGSKSTVPEY